MFYINGQIELPFTPSPVGTDTDWKAIASGIRYLLFLKNDGTLWAYGYNDHGQLGDGNTTELKSLTQIGTSADWKEISTFSNHTLGIKTDGTLWAWGDNRKGELGNGSITASLIPTQIGADTDWSSVTVGSGFSMALKEDGTLWFWGSLLWEGHPESVFQSRVPVQVGTDADWISISAGSTHVTALKRTPFPVPEPQSVQAQPTAPQIRVFPNPATHTLHIIPDNQNDVNSLQLSDVAGRTVWSSGEAVKEISVGGFGRGIYFLQIATSGGNTTQKIVLE